MSQETINSVKSYSVENICFSYVGKTELISEVNYIGASGAFNVKIKLKNEDLFEHILLNLKIINEILRKGFLFNVFISDSDIKYAGKDFYYAYPLWLFGFCK